MRTITLASGQRLGNADLHRSGALPRNVMDAAAAIVDDVRDRGDEAVREYTLRFDGTCPDSFRVPDDVVRGARDLVDPEFLASLELAARQIEEFHALHVAESWMGERADGVRLGVRVPRVTRIDSR